YTLEGAKPIYQEFKGWQKSKGAREFDALPVEAQEYIAKLEELCGAKIGIISTSPDRDDTIVRD
ncbi:MAG TPA: adenylosuccinate synthase, partial [Nitratifractor sp.]|nr:adenylosuccinate synthase [Nitratifractor sp.]